MPGCPESRRQAQSHRCRSTASSHSRVRHGQSRRPGMQLTPQQVRLIAIPPRCSVAFRHTSLLLLCLGLGLGRLQHCLPCLPQSAAVHLMHSSHPCSGHTVACCASRPGHAGCHSSHKLRTKHGACWWWALAQQLPGQTDGSAQAEALTFPPSGGLHSVQATLPPRPWGKGGGVARSDSASAEWGGRGGW